MRETSTSSPTRLSVESRTKSRDDDSDGNNKKRVEETKTERIQVVCTDDMMRRRTYPSD